MVAASVAAPESPEVRTRDPERTRTAILRAAVAEFAHHGPLGARTEAIAVRAGVDKKLLYYYFGTKDDLFLAAIELAYADIRSAERALRLDALEPAEAVRSLVAFTWRHYVEHPEFLRLLASENLLHAAHLKRSTRVRDLNSPLVALIAEVVARGERSGAFRAGIDPLQLYVSIAGLAWFYLSNNHTLSTIFGRDLGEPAAMEARLAHITDVVMAYVLAP